MGDSLKVEEQDIVGWFDLLVADQAVIDRVTDKKQSPDDMANAKRKAETEYQFPGALKTRFPSLNLYDGDTVGVGEGGRASGSDEQWACVCSLAVMTTCLRAYIASKPESSDTAIVKKATAMLTQYQTRGSKLFGVSHPANPLTEENVVAWGAALNRHADDPEKMGASYLTMVIHDLTKVKSIVAPLAERYPTLNDEALTAKFIEAVCDQEVKEWEGKGLSDIKTCNEKMRLAIQAGFKTGFNASQVMQGESTSVDGHKVANFLKQHPDALWFMAHYLLDTAGILGKKHAFIGSVIVDGNTFVPYNAYINCLVSGKPLAEDATREVPDNADTSHKEYHTYRMDMVQANDGPLKDGLEALATDLAVPTEHMELAFARTVELSRATSNEAALGLLKCWEKAKERFGPELMAGLVNELNIDGLAEGGSLVEIQDALKVSVMLEYSPKALNDAAKGEDWEAEVAILLGLFAVLWRCGRAAIVAQAEAGETRNPYTVTINPIAMRTAPKYAESSGYTWLQWFGEMLAAWKASNALAPLLEKAVCAKELQLEWAANI
eukprot:COSAG06_NODE_5557_length_3404_cov_1.466566_1_plen_551_part_00